MHFTLFYFLQTLDELSELLSMERSELEQTVHDNRCDEISAMFNMIMDKKRVAKGYFFTFSLH